VAVQCCRQLHIANTAFQFTFVVDLQFSAAFGAVKIHHECYFAFCTAQLICSVNIALLALYRVPASNTASYRYANAKFGL